LAGSAAGALADALQFPIVRVAPDVSVDVLAGEAMALLAAHAEAMELDAARERAALAELRQQHMEMQSAYVQVEEFAYHSLAPKFTRTQEFRNHDERVTLEPGGPALLQRLPFSMHSMAALDVYLAEPAAGTLVLTMKRGIGADFAPPVELALEGLTPGWVRFPFLRVLEGAPEDAFAEIEYRGTGSAVLALSHPSPVADYHVKIGQETRPFPLALRGFRGLPGARLPDMQMPRMAPPPDGKARMVMALDLWPIKMLPRVHKAVKFVGYKEYVAADYWDDENAFMVHPSTERPVVGIVRNISASALTRVSSVIHLANAKSQPVAFALGVAPAGKVRRMGQAMRYLTPWTVLAAGEFGVAEQRLADPAQGKVDLLLATSMEGQTANTKAWALFRDFSFTNGVKGA
ncbi:MAG: DUF6212 domain-containing protein, partial [Pseudomonadota bacterium]